MHDLDRTLTEMPGEGPYEFNPLSLLGFETNPEAYQETYQEVYPETYPETYQETYQEAYPGEMAAMESPLNENEEITLATELLSVSSEEELDHFLGNLISKAGKFLASPAGNALKGILKNVAKKALPIAGSALGGLIGGPAGAMIGGKLAPMAGKLFGLEVGGLSPEDARFEIARRYVKLASSAAARAAQTPTNVQPYIAAKRALIASARRYAPGLLVPSKCYQNSCVSKPGTYAAPGIQPTNIYAAPNIYGGTPNVYAQAGAGRSGRWIRRGNHIVLYGVY